MESSSSAVPVPDELISQIPLPHSSESSIKDSIKEEIIFDEFSANNDAKAESSSSKSDVDAAGARRTDTNTANSTPADESQVGAHQPQHKIIFRHGSGSTFTIQGDTDSFFVRKIDDIVYLDGLGVSIEVNTNVTGLSIQRSKSTLTFTCQTGNYLPQTANTSLNFNRNYGFRYGLWNENRSNRQRSGQISRKRGRFEPMTEEIPASYANDYYYNYYYRNPLFYHF